MDSISMGLVCLSILTICLLIACLDHLNVILMFVLRSITLFYVCSTCFCSSVLPFLPSRGLFDIFLAFIFCDSDYIPLKKNFFVVALVIIKYLTFSIGLESLILLPQFGRGLLLPYCFPCML